MEEKKQSLVKRFVKRTLYFILVLVILNIILGFPISLALRGLCEHGLSYGACAFASIILLVIKLVLAFIISGDIMRGELFGKRKEK